MISSVPNVLLTQPCHPVAPWQGKLDLQFAMRQGQTIPAYHLAIAPLKVQRPFYKSDGSCQMVMVHTAGGMVGGDQLEIQVEAATQTSALVTTAAAHKVYRSTGAIAQQDIHLNVSEGACLDWFPQEAIIFEGALYRQSLRVDIAPGAHWFGWDLMRFGRSARGERFLSGEWQSQTEVWSQGKPLWIDRQWLSGGSDVLDSPHGLAGQPVIATLVAIGTDLSAQTLAELCDRITQQFGTMLETADLGVTQLQSGILCRYRGDSTQQARQWFINIWQYLKPQITGKAVHIPRVWGN